MGDLYRSINSKFKVAATIFFTIGGGKNSKSGKTRNNFFEERVEDNVWYQIKVTINTYLQFKEM